MTDKKLTDEEIISSLEVIATTCNCNECKIRSGKWGTCNCSETTANAALDLINHQKAEIEQLKEEANRYQNLYCMAVDDIETAKSEAIKEFAERFKRIAGIYQKDTYVIGVDEFDNLVKEKVGDTVYFDTYLRGDSIGVRPHKVIEVKCVIMTEPSKGGIGAEIPDWAFGESVFLTREEAERL